jgi:hypothetical protein
MKGAIFIFLKTKTKDEKKKTKKLLNEGKKKDNKKEDMD